MQFGVCGGPDLAAVAGAAGYDFMESTVGGLLKPREDAAAFEAGLSAWQDAALPCQVVNCFVPGDLKITGPQVDQAALESYVTTTCERAGQTAVEVIVFGSGGARRIPDGFDRNQAHEQLVTFCQMVGPVAQIHGLTIVVEPLNRQDCNVLTTVGECARLVQETDHPAVRLLVDAYHWGKDNDAAEDIVAHGALLAHTHIATLPNRRPPGVEACDLEPFFQALEQGGYDGRVSIEGRIEDAQVELPQALACMRALAG